MSRTTAITCPKCSREKLIIVSSGDRNVLKCPDAGCGYSAPMR